MSGQYKTTRADRAAIFASGVVHRETSVKATAKKYGLSLHTVYLIRRGQRLGDENSVVREERA